MKTGTDLQKEIRKYLKDKGCDVLILNPRSGIPTGWPDITFFKEGFWGTIECKKNKYEPYRPRQKETIARHGEWSWSRRVDWSTWDETRNELEAIL